MKSSSTAPMLAAGNGHGMYVVDGAYKGQYDYYKLSPLLNKDSAHKEGRRLRSFIPPKPAATEAIEAPTAETGK